MQDVIAERRRVVDGPLADESHPGIVVDWTIRAQEPAAVLDRVRDTLAAVLGAIIDRPDDPDSWSSDLPEWFIEMAAPEVTDEESAAFAATWASMTQDERRQWAIDSVSRPWPLSNWLYWFDASEVDRGWTWWNAVVDDGRILVELLVDGLPYPSDALQWLFYAAGASTIEYESLA